MRFVIVKRGALSTFHLLEQSCKDIADLCVIWDRRRDPDRRSKLVAGDRRPGDRRRPAPHSWTSADHVLVEAHSVESPVGISAPEVTQERRSI